MNRSPNPDAAIREAVEYFVPESNGNHTYTWPYDVSWFGNGAVGTKIRGYQADINISVDPPIVEVIHWDTLDEKATLGDPYVRLADTNEIATMARLIEEDHGADAPGLKALQAFAVQMAQK